MFTAKTTKSGNTQSPFDILFIVGPTNKSSREREGERKRTSQWRVESTARVKKMERKRQERERGRGAGPIGSDI